MRPVIYITTEGARREYLYPRYVRSHSNNRKPYCPLAQCKQALTHIKVSVKQKQIKIGYYCKVCNALFIKPEYKLFKLKEDD